MEENLSPFWDDTDIYWAEADWADRWLTAWEILEPLGVVQHPDDTHMPLNELERLASLIGDPT